MWISDWAITLSVFVAKGYENRAHLMAHDYLLSMGYLSLLQELLAYIPLCSPGHLHDCPSHNADLLQLPPRQARYQGGYQE